MWWLGLCKSGGCGGVQEAIAVGCRARKRLGGEVYVCYIVWIGRFPAVGKGGSFGTLKTSEHM